MVLIQLCMHTSVLRLRTGGQCELRHSELIHEFRNSELETQHICFTLDILNTFVLNIWSIVLYALCNIDSCIVPFSRVGNLDFKLLWLIIQLKSWYVVTFITNLVCANVTHLLYANLFIDICIFHRRSWFFQNNWWWHQYASISWQYRYCIIRRCEQRTRFVFG